MYQRQDQQSTNAIETNEVAWEETYEFHPNGTGFEYVLRSLVPVKKMKTNLAWVVSDQIEETLDTYKTEVVVRGATEMDGMMWNTKETATNEKLMQPKIFVNVWSVSERGSLRAYF